jgi:outer membrane lipopolysaccharide assembly protein LptE/RlpB|tara:strand:+ start:3047 stop:3508 length:462 start_codon:yes stop_codon:yes gene_type:complete
MINLKKNILLFIFVFATGCGFSPLLNSEKIDFYISDLKIEGDREVNKYILHNFKKFKKPRDNSKKYNLIISSNYQKKIINKDNKGNPKNYDLRVKINVNIISSGENTNNKIFERNISLSAKSKKITEIELERKYKENLSNLLSEDIVFFLTNQ